MKIEYVVGLNVLAILVIILVSIYTADLLYFTKFPAVAPFGMGMLIFLILVTVFVIIAKANSPKLITGKGTFSMNFEKDLIPIPWAVEVNEDKAKEIEGMDYFLYLTGGINKYGLSIRGRSDSAIVLAPANYDEKIGACQVNRTILEDYDVEELPPNHQYYVKNSFAWRIKKNTRILYGAVSRWDGTSTSKNLTELMKQREYNRELAFWQDRAIRLYDESERYKKHREPNILLKKEKVEEYENE